MYGHAFKMPLAFYARKRLRLRLFVVDSTGLTSTWKQLIHYIELHHKPPYRTPLFTQVATPSTCAVVEQFNHVALMRAKAVQ